jgi:hypothetical protein
MMDDALCVVLSLLSCLLESFSAFVAADGNKERHTLL